MTMLLQLIESSETVQTNDDLAARPSKLSLSKPKTVWKSIPEIVDEAATESKPSTMVDLSYRNMKKLPLELRDLKDMVVYRRGCLDSSLQLSLSFNRIHRLSSWFFDLTNLIYLDLSNNNLPHVDPLIGQLKRLEIFSIRCNQVRYLPEEIKHLPFLKRINVFSNPLITEEEAKILKFNNYTPQVLSLFEIASRCILNMDQASTVISRLPWHLELPLEQASKGNKCSRCKKHFFKLNVCKLEFHKVADCTKLPLLRRFCSHACTK